MKNLILLLMLPLMSFGQLLVDTIPQNKKAVLEEFTGIHCVFCPDGHVIAQQIKNTYPNDVSLINLHTGGYALPNQGEPDFRIMESDSIAAISNLAGYPAGTVNRYQFPMTQGGGTAMSRGDWMDAVQDIISQPAYLNVGMQVIHDTTNEVLVVDVEVYYTDSTPVDGFGFSPVNYINVALTQDSVVGPQIGASSYNPAGIVPGPWQPSYSHQHMLRDMVTGQWGDPITNGGQTLPGHFIFKRYIYEIQPYINDVMFLVEHIKAVAFVTESIHGEIISANECEVTYPTPPPVAVVEMLPIINNNIVYDIYGRAVTSVKKNTIYIKNNKKFIQF